jgi:NADH dehydrogenase
VKRFVFFSALNASEFQRTRFFRAKALAEAAVEASPLSTTVFAPSIVYGRDDRFITLVRRLSLLPLLPVSGEGRALYQPIWAADVAGCIAASLQREGGRFELAGPELLSHEAIVRMVAATSGRRRPVVHVPLGFVRLGLIWLRRLFGDTAFATWEEAELMEVPMITQRGTADAEELGVSPRPMGEVLGG